jgi:hypothetical protein
MKTTLLFLLLIPFLNLQLYSQDYEPMIKEGSFWDVRNAVNVAVYPSTEDRYRISGDTIINNITYKKLQKAPIRTSNKNLLWLSDKKFINSNEFIDLKHIFLREDIQEKKVYIYVDHNVFFPYEEIKKEYTYCDFSLNKEDEVTNIYSLDNPFTFKIININNTSSYNQRKEYYLNGYAARYIEGVGKFNFPFESYDMNYVLGDTASEIFCHGNDATQNNCAKKLNTKNHELSNIKAFPNPVNDILKITNIENVTVRVFSINGKLLKKEKIEKDAHINVTDSTQGIYFIELSKLNSKKRLKFLKL